MLYQKENLMSEHSSMNLEKNKPDSALLPLTVITTILFIIEINLYFSSIPKNSQQPCNKIFTCTNMVVDVIATSFYELILYITLPICLVFLYRLL